MENENQEYNGSCHCGAVSVEVAARPDYLNECNCSMCGKLGVWWGYYDIGDVRVRGETATYTRADNPDPSVAIHFCRICGNCTHWAAMPQFVKNTGISGVMGVNMRLFDRNRLRGIELRFPDGKNWDGKGQWGFVKAAELLT